jgi:Disulphide bond corrector protein DsbC
MNMLKHAALIALLLFGTSSFAQVVEDPTTWTYEVKKKSVTEYQLIFHLDIKAGWHIWSLHPGGDGYEIAPTFTFDKNPKVKLKGKTIEKGKATTTKMDGIDGKITYMSGKIDYIQEVTVTGSTKITGKHGYQVCNDRMCLPPKDKDFVFDIK